MAGSSAWNGRGEQLRGGQTRFYRRGGRVQLTSPVSLDVSVRALGLAAYEVAILDTYVGTSDSEASQRASRRLKNWPVIWAVVIDFGITEVAFAVGSPHVSREAAETAAWVEVQEQAEFHGLAPSDGSHRTDDCSTVEELIARGEPWVILYGPLSPTAFGVLCQQDRSSDENFENTVIELQQAHAWKLTITTALAMRELPSLLRRRIFAYAFSALALNDQ